MNDVRFLRSAYLATLEVSDAEWTYIDGPLMGDVCIETRPSNPGRTKIRLDPGPLGPFIEASRNFPQMLDEIERLRHENDRLTKRLSEALMILESRCSDE